MIAPTPFFSHRGTHIRIFEEARALEQRGHEVTIVTYHVGDDIHKYVETKIDVRRIRRWLFWYKKTSAGADWQKVILNIFLIRKVLWLTYKKRPDIIHGHLHEGIIIGKLAQLLFFWRRMKLVADFHGSLVGEMRSHGYLSLKPLERLFRSLEGAINALGNAAVVSSKDHLATIKNARGDHRAYHIFDGVNTEAYKALSSIKEALRQKYQVPLDAVVVAYTGGLVENKGVSAFLDALGKLNYTKNKIHIVVGGDNGEWAKNYIKDVDKKNLTLIYPLNYFLLPEINTIADITVDPKEISSAQASGKILQYMAARTATICAKRETNHYYLGEDAYYISEISPEKIAVAIEDLAHDTGKTKILAAGAQKRVEQFGWHKVGERLEGVYLSI